MIPLLALLLLSPPPTIELYTMGPGDEVFSRFGHAALCVIPAEDPNGVCYNYGTADFTRPLALGLDFIRGRARFHVSRADLSSLLADYQEADRSVYVQVLPLRPEAAWALAAALEADMAPERRSYVYHHFRDNCSTRLRDHIDAASGGALLGGGAAPAGGTWRDRVEAGFAGEPLLLAASLLFLGRAGDRPVDVAAAMFHPDALRLEVAGKLGAPADLVSARQAPLARGGPSGLAVLLGAGVVLGVLTALGAASRSRILRRLGLGVAGLGLGLLGVALWTAAVAASLPELRWNENLLVLLPVNLAIAFLPRRGLHRYLEARLVGLALVGGLAAAGLLRQPLAGPILLAALPLAGARLVHRGAAS